VIARLRNGFRNLLHGLWFVPGAIVAALALLAIALMLVDSRLGTNDVGVFFGGDYEAARDVLSTIAAAVATVAGVVFSITIVTLQLVSSQFSPRALRGFLSDRVQQVTAGVFVGTFAYCLLVLRSVRGGDDAEEFVPALSVTVAVVLGLASLVLLLVFVHHVANSVQVSTIAERIGRSTLRAVERMYPEGFGEPAGGTQAAETLVADWELGAPPARVRAERAGYVQSIALTRLGTNAHGPLRMQVRVTPGEFVTTETVLAAWWCGGGEDDLGRRVRSAVTITNERDVAQDVSFGLQQLVDIAVRALSPSLNDPTTATTCVGYLRAALERLASQGLPSPVRAFSDDVTIVAARRDFEDYVEQVVYDVGRHAVRTPRVVSLLLDAARSAAQAALDSGALDRVAVLVSAAEAVGLAAMEEAGSEHDRLLLGRRLTEIHDVRLLAEQQGLLGDDELI
jgi:uncharacterized membrane protein